MQSPLAIPPAISPLYSTKRLSLDEFLSLCKENPELQAELEPDGRIKIMSPVSFGSGRNEAKFIIKLGIYAEEVGGEVASSAVGLKLPDGSVRSPDACYITKEKIANFTDEDFRHFLPVVPEFVVEVASPSDAITDLEAKMRESWIANGVRLAWLADVDNDRLWIYRADRSVELVSPLDRTITGEDVLPGFTFDLNLLS
ncbi:Uma2 family endonuclease [Lewinella sp. IMCC34191]|uniref:Uma2 family endonuclease n=1 Tax=Lewinella sp. IMCC34191 TaxID=2259172 RepID=UPI000E26404C|nr:Uma2 family endonuclease [Lewinella sp. IMCC34191]